MHYLDEVIVYFHVLANEEDRFKITINTFLHSLPLDCLVLTRTITYVSYWVVPENIHTPPTEVFFFLVSTSHPSGNSSFVSYFL